MTWIIPTPLPAEFLADRILLALMPDDVTDESYGHSARRLVHAVLDAHPDATFEQLSPASSVLRLLDLEYLVRLSLDARRSDATRRSVRDYLHGLPYGELWHGATDHPTPAARHRAVHEIVVAEIVHALGQLAPVDHAFLARSTALDASLATTTRQIARYALVHRDRYAVDHQAYSLFDFIAHQVLVALRLGNPGAMLETMDFLHRYGATMRRNMERWIDLLDDGRFDARAWRALGLIVQRTGEAAALANIIQIGRADAPADRMPLQAAQ